MLFVIFHFSLSSPRGGREGASGEIVGALRLLLFEKNHNYYDFCLDFPLKKRIFALLSEESPV